MSDIKLFHRVTTVYELDGTEIVGRDRESYFLHFPGQGAVEAWRTKSPVESTWTRSGYYGGIEVHYKNEPEDASYMGHRESCWVTGGECWSDGSSLAFDEVEFDFENPAYIQNALFRWAENRFSFSEGERR